jgi:23S rRNA pseudouridine1911/1915/1917 synthase
MIRKEGKNYFRARTGEGGKEAELEYRVVKEGARNSLAEIKLGTGRFHQIRAQMGSIGHPVLGDVKYGSPVVLPGGKIALHSSKISFKAATEERTVNLTVADPDFFADIL